jgi:hypothetical protein
MILKRELNKQKKVQNCIQHIETKDLLNNYLNLLHKNLKRCQVGHNIESIKYVESLLESLNKALFLKRPIVLIQIVINQVFVQIFLNKLKDLIHIIFG